MRSTVTVQHPFAGRFTRSTVALGAAAEAGSLEDLFLRLEAAPLQARRELPFAGHPTLGVCHVFAELSGNGGESFVQECGAGLVSLHRTQDGLLSFAAPPLVRSGPTSAS